MSITTCLESFWGAKAPSKLHRGSESVEDKFELLYILQVFKYILGCLSEHLFILAS